MKQIITILAVFSLVLLSPVSIPAQQPSVPIMEADELEPGMEGYGLTVFHGTEPERFKATILGSVNNNWPGTDMIIAELEHPALKDVGVVAGMSGSPVYVDGKLIGAIAYGWGFSVRPIAGITPIRRMMEVIELTTKEDLRPEERWSEGVRHWPEARQALGLPETPANLRPFEVPQTVLASMGISGMNDPQASVTFRPLAMPLGIATNSPLVMNKAKDIFGSSGLFPVMAGGGGSKLGDPEYADVEMQPGSAFSVVMVTGDLEISGTGTATYFEGNRMVGFGHSMYGLGAVDAPTAVSEIVTVMPSLQFPFKLGYPVREMGALRQDRLFAVGVALDSQSEMAPIKFHVLHGELDVDQTFNYKVIKDRYYMPSLAWLCVLESVGITSTLDGPLSMGFDYTIHLADGTEIKKEHFFSAEAMTNMMAAETLAVDLERIQNNRFRPMKVTSIEGTIRLDELRQIMVQDRVVRARTRVFPGQTVKAVAEYARWREGSMKVPIEIRVPEDTPPGEYGLFIADGPTRRELELGFRPELREVDDVEDLLEQVKPNYPENEIYVLLVDQSEKLIVRRQRLENLPDSVAAITEATSRDPQLTFKSQGSLLAEKRIPFSARVAGFTVIPITVEKR